MNDTHSSSHHSKKQSQSHRRTPRSLSPHHNRRVLTNTSIHNNKSLSPPRRIHSLEEQDYHHRQLNQLPRPRIVQRTSSTNSSNSAAEAMRDTAVQLMDLMGIDANELQLPFLQQPQQPEEEDEDNYDDYKVKNEEIQTIVNDHEEFLRLKAALKAKGAVTNGMLQQRLHVYVHKNRDRLLQSGSGSSHHERTSQKEAPTQPSSA